MTFREYILIQDSDLRDHIAKFGCHNFCNAKDLLHDMHQFHRLFIYDAEIKRLWTEYARQTSAQVPR